MKTEYQIIAVDFDGTLCTDCFPKIGQPNTALIELLKGLRRQERQIILWTCRCGNQLEEAVEWCRKWELEFGAVRESAGGYRKVRCRRKKDLCGCLY